MSASEKAQAATEAPDDRGDDAEARMLGYAKIGIPLAVIVAAIVGGATMGAGAVFLVLSAGALIGVIAVLWASLRTFLGETPLAGADAYAMGAPRSEEEQKRAILRALKDLDFERGVGKITEEDYVALTAKYRAEAKRLLRRLDDAALPEVQRAEALIASRLRRAGLAKGDDDASNDDDDAKGESGPVVDEKPKSGGKRRKDRVRSMVTKPDHKPVVHPAKGPTKVCSECSTENDPDAVFCKKCGHKQVAAPSEDATEETDRAEA